MNHRGRGQSGRVLSGLIVSQSSSDAVIEVSGFKVGLKQNVDARWMMFIQPLIKLL